MENANPANVQRSISADLEKAVIKICSEVLNISSEELNINDNFFLLGGDSLLLAQVMIRIIELFPVDLAFSDLFEAPDIKTICQFVHNLHHAELEKFSIEPADRAHVLPATAAQQGLWYINQLLDGEEIIYNTPIALEINGDLDISALTQSFNSIISRHEILRTTFHLNNDKTQLCQIIHEQSILEIPVITINSCDVLTNMLEHARRPFDLAKGVLLNVKLLHLADSEYVLLINLHHIISDGWSGAIFFNELSKFYNAYKNNNSCSLRPLTLQYADYAHWQYQYKNTVSYNNQLNYWKSQMRNAPQLLNFPTDRPRPRVLGFHGNSVTFSVSSTTIEKLVNLAHDNNATLYMILLAVFKVLLFRYSNQNDIVVGTTVANRTRPEFRDLIGFFSNTLPLRSNVTSNMPFIDFLDQVKRMCLDAFENQDIPFETIVSEINPGRSQSHAVFFQVMFILQNMTFDELDFEGLDIRRKEYPSETSRFDLTLEFFHLNNGLNGRMEYNTELFNKDTIENIIKRYKVLLENILLKPTQRIAELKLITNEEYIKLVHGKNQVRI